MKIIPNFICAIGINYYHKNYIHISNDRNILEYNKRNIFKIYLQNWGEL